MKIQYKNLKAKVSARKQALKLARRTWIVILALAIGLGAVPSLVHADPYDQAIKQAEEAQRRHQNQADQLGAEANTIQDQINNLQAQIASIQSQIDVNQKKHADLLRQIEAAEKELARQRRVLGQNIKAMYLEGDVSTIEMLASSKNISEYLDKQQYRNVVKDKITETVKKIADLKKQLGEQRRDVENLLEEQNKLHNELSGKRAEADAKLAQTNQIKAAFDARVHELQQEIQAARAAQLAAIAAATGGGTRNFGSIGGFNFRNIQRSGNPCGGGYPKVYCQAAQDSVVDEWDLFNRECVSYVAWALQYRLGKAVPEFNGQGHAYQWPGYLSARGKKVNQTPAVGAAAVVPAETLPAYGHVMLVEEILDDGWVRVSQFNWDVNGTYSTMEIKGGVYYIHF